MIPSGTFMASQSSYVCNGSAFVLTRQIRIHSTICAHEFPTTISFYDYAFKCLIFLQVKKLTGALISEISMEKVKKQKNGLKAKAFENESKTRTFEMVLSN